MGLRINTNIQSLVAQNRLQENFSSLQHTQEKLATGSRIINAMDDAAGLAISENLRATMRATAENVRNAQNGLLLLKTADGGLNEITNIIIRMKELTIQAASDTNGPDEKAFLDMEYQNLKAEINRISEATTFNGRPLLNGMGGQLQIQIGPNNVEGLDRIEVSADYHMNLDILEMEDLNIDNAEGAREAIDPATLALNKIASLRAHIGASQSRLNTAISSLKLYEENSSEAFSSIRDADIAFETAQLAKYNILSQAGAAVLSQANSTPQLALKLLG